MQSNDFSVFTPITISMPLPDRMCPVHAQEIIEKARARQRVMMAAATREIEKRDRTLSVAHAQ